MMTHPLRAVVATWLAGALLVPFVSAAASAVDPLSVPGFVAGMVAGVVVAFVVAGVPYIGLSFTAGTRVARLVGVVVAVVVFTSLVLSGFPWM